MRRTLSAVLLLFTLAPLSAADWPQWGGPNRDGVSPETGLLKAWPKGGPKLAWKADLGGVGYGSPAVAGDRLFVAAAEDDKDGKKEFALCLSAKDGSQLWKVELPVGAGGYSTGWGSGPRSTPTADGDAVHFLGPRGVLVRLKTADGSKVWAVNLVKDFGGGTPGWGYSESVLIDGDHLICTPGGKNGTILALDKKTGKKLWQSKELTDGAAYASIIPADVGGVRQYVTQTDGAAVGVRAKDGKLLWRKADLKRRTAVIPSPVVHDGYAFFTAGYGAGCELFKLTSKGDATTAETVYTKNPVMQNHHGGVVRIGDYVYGYSDTGGQWECVEYKDRDLTDPVWKSKALEKGSVIAAGGCLYCYGQGKGECVLAEASPKGWKELGRFTIPEKSKFPRRGGAIWTHPAVANGKLYLRDHEKLFCYEIAAK
jgi:outer membrane protein assembly factor BamB